MLNHLYNHLPCFEFSVDRAAHSTLKPSNAVLLELGANQPLYGKRSRLFTDIF